MVAALGGLLAAVLLGPGMALAHAEIVKTEPRDVCADRELGFVLAPDSPCAVGTVLTRRSSSLPCTRSMMRPSCGRRRSAMLSFAMILMRLMIAAVRLAGGLSASSSTPSTR